jgi:DNA-binding transcriptional ArsR family regulator
MYHAPMIQERHAENVARALGEPTRIRILARLLHGPATVADLVGHTESTQPNVSNHLAVLRTQGLVRGDRAGRQVRYRLANASVAQLVEAIIAISATGSRLPPTNSPLAEARTCYDHLAGRLGVTVLEALVREGAITAAARRDGIIHVGHRTELFDLLGVDISQAAKARRRFAFGCLDWTERRAHLGGALGAAVTSRLLEIGWLQRQQRTRALLLTSKGRRGLKRTLGIE